MYINRGRFGEFVRSVIEADYARRKDETEKDDDWKLWFMYLQSFTISTFSGVTFDESFHDWKERVCKPVAATQGKNGDMDMSEDDIQNILDKLFPA